MSRPAILDRLVIGAALALAALLLWVGAQKGLQPAVPSPAAAPAVERAAAPASAIVPSGTREGVLSLPPLKVAGVGRGPRRRAKAPPPPR